MDLSNNVTTNIPIATQGLFMTTYDKMDDLNKKAAQIMLTSGPEAAIKHMFTDTKGETLTYLEMRERYG
jgi:hypothetical protein